MKSTRAQSEGRPHGYKASRGNPPALSSPVPIDHILIIVYFDNNFVFRVIRTYGKPFW